MPCSDVPASTVDELYQEISKVQVEIQEREMSLETFQVRIGEAEAKTNDLKASFENLWGMVKMPQDASSSTVRDTRGLSGSKIVVEEILKVLREADWKASLHWKSMPLEFAEDSPYDLVAADGKTTLNPSSWTFYRVIQWD
ncbi:hypothetical protein GBA52_007196 [Prunus armeniaca]|nr:hypothetical protein GBA52_007196 [Prunus armeniaca]